MPFIHKILTIITYNNPIIILYSNLKYVLCYRVDRETYSYKFFRWLIFSRIKSAIGFDRCKYFISAAAPISVELKKYFMSLDIPLCEVK